MSIEKLISYPVVPLFLPQMLEAFNNKAISGEALLNYGIEDTVRSTIVVKLLQDGDNPVFVLGEALQSVDDDFSKEIGVTIAEGRATLCKEDYEYVNWITFSLEDALETKEDLFGRTEDEELIEVSKVVLPISLIPLPHGIVNRLRMLLPR